MSTTRAHRSHRSRFAQCCYYCRTVITFVFSHIGLCGVVFGYSVCGAFTFQTLEADNELEYRQIMLKIRHDVVEQLWSITHNSTVLVQNDWSENALKTLISFEHSLVDAVRQKGYDGKDDTDPRTLQWNFFGALLYSIIVITTIGYGNIAPKTKTGRIVTIVYAIFGIPLMLLMLSNIGDAMAHSFKFIYWKCCCILCVNPRKRHRRKHSKHASKRTHRKYNHVEHIAMQTYTTEGPSDVIQSPPPRISRSRRPHSYAADRQSSHFGSQRKVICNTYALQSETFDDFAIHDYSPSDYKVKPPYSTLPPNFSLSPPINHLPLPPPQTPPPLQLNPLQLQYENYDSTDAESDISDDHNEIPNVPITLCIALVVSYICGGALLFKLWEPWSFLDACYFCFVTLTTIGFGDLVPGTAVFSRDAHNRDAQTTLGICALYLLFGMALLAMSFNLVKEEVTKSVRSIGKRVGIIAKDNDDSDDSD